MKTILEKLLPPKWWRKPAQAPGQFWAAFAGTSEDNPVYRALMHEAQEIFMQNAMAAFDRTRPDGERLAAANAAADFARFMQRVEEYRAGAGAELERLAK